MRLFVAVEIAPDVVAAVVELIDRLQQRAKRLAPKARLTWVTAERTHVTIRFIGQVENDAGDAIRDALALPLAVPPFELTVAGAGTFPPKGPPRVVWAGLRNGRDGLVAIEKQVSARLVRLGFESVARPYNPHLTLARVREAAGLKSAALLEGITASTLGVSPVRAITLFESRLSPKGPTYVPIQRTALRPA
jgi:2'-5' RNA ligase